MPHARSTRPTRVVAWSGALLFAVAIGWSAWAYLVAFGQPAGPWTWRDGLAALVFDAAGFTTFALHHSLFARTGVKRVIESRLSPHLERPFYVIVSSVLFGLLLWLWLPVPGVLWHVTGPPGLVLHGLQVSGVLLTVHASRRLGVRALVGLEPPETDEDSPALCDTGVYSRVRHPVYFAWLLMVWPTPLMTGSRLTFAGLSTLYLIAAIPLEERTLVRQFGAAYRDYQRRVRWRIVPFVF